MLPPKLESEAGPSTIFDTVPDAQSTGSNTTATQRKRPARRDKPFIEHGPDQPPTFQMSARVPFSRSPSPHLPGFPVNLPSTIPDLPLFPESDVSSTTYDDVSSNISTVRTPSVNQSAESVEYCELPRISFVAPDSFHPDARHDVDYARLPPIIENLQHSDPFADLAKLEECR